MTDQEVDEVLVSFDQTEPKLQRKIIAKLVAKAAAAETALEACKLLIQTIENPPANPLALILDRNRVETLARKAVSIAET